METADADSLDGGFLDRAEAANQCRADQDGILLPVESHNSCKYCCSPHLERVFLDVFSIPICKKCSYEHLKLITKTSCKEDYLLSDCEIKHFKFIERPNPHKHGWNSMQLYNKEEIENHTIKRFGSLLNLENEKKKRSEEKRNRKIKKMQIKIKEMRKHTFILKKANKHKHTFIQKGSYGICECGMEVEQEEI